MFQEFLADSPYAGWALAAFLLFFGVFIGVLVYILRGAMAHRSYEREASLPLDDEASNGGSAS